MREVKHVLAAVQRAAQDKRLGELSALKCFDSTAESSPV